MEAKDVKETLVTVKVKKPYKDMEKMLLFHEGEEHKVTEKRAKELVGKGLVEIIPEKKA